MSTPRTEPAKYALDGALNLTPGIRVRRLAVLDFLELADDHVALGKAGNDLEFSARGSGQPAERADLHI
jgi:hypothetical protein